MSVRRSIRGFVLALAPFFATACGTVDAPPGLAVTSNTATRFAATYRPSNGPGISVAVTYTSNTRAVSFTTLRGEPIPMEGAGGPTLLGPRDAAYEAVRGLRAALVAEGVPSLPSPAQRGTPRYAAAYWATRLLGELETSVDLRGSESFWPYPGFTDSTLLPPELQPTSYDSISVPGSWCCGPNNCALGPSGTGTTCSPNNPNNLDDWWCAAGDHCNQFHMWRSYPNGTCGDPTWIPWDPDHSFHKTSTILQFVGSGTNTGCNVKTSTCPRAYCSDPWARTAQWAAEGRGYCHCAGADGAFCGSALTAWAAQYHCGADPALGYNDQSILTCANNTWSMIDACTSGTCADLGNRDYVCQTPIQPAAPPPPPFVCSPGDTKDCGCLAPGFVSNGRECNSDGQWGPCCGLDADGSPLCCG